MDPDTALANARAAVTVWHTAQDYPDPDLQALAAGAGLVDAFDALDKWLSAGGFLPEDWSGAG